MKKILLTIAAASALAAGCATDATTKSSGEDVNERVYRTGSNIPTKQKAGSSEGLSEYDREALSRARDQAYQPPPRAAGTP